MDFARIFESKRLVFIFQIQVCQPSAKSSTQCLAQVTDRQSQMSTRDPNSCEKVEF
jgi:hypothetical protein